jgi:hypothetical protein
MGFSEAFIGSASTNTFARMQLLDTKRTSEFIEKTMEFLQDCKSLGLVRFVVVGNGAILESMGEFQNLRYTETSKGMLATVSTESPAFECHLYLNEIKSIKPVLVNKFDKNLRVFRFLSGEDKTLLSVIMTESASKHQLDAWYAIY